MKKQFWIGIEPVMLLALARMDAEEFAAVMRARLPEGARIVAVGYDGERDQYGIVYEREREAEAAGVAH